MNPFRFALRFARVVRDLGRTRRKIERMKRELPAPRVEARCPDCLEPLAPDGRCCDARFGRNTCERIQPP